MNEIAVSQSQVEDSLATLESATTKVFSRTDASQGLYRPDQMEVPRPNFRLFEAQLQLYQEQNHRPPASPVNGRYEVAHGKTAALSRYPGLCGLSKTEFRDSRGIVQYLVGPAIVLSTGSHIAILIAERPSPTISMMQHNLLEDEYVKHEAKVASHHTERDATNAGAIGPALVVVSSEGSANPHRELHSLARSSNQQGTFGSNFSNQGRQDIQVGHQVRRTRSIVVAADNAVFYAGVHDQLPDDALLLGIKLSSSELAIGRTLAATSTRTGSPLQLTSNLVQMVGE